MKPVPIINSDPMASLWGTMLFPDDADAAAGFVTFFQGRTIPAAVREGYDWTDAQQQEFFANFEAVPLAERKLQQRYHEKDFVGEIVRCLWFLICERKDQASIDLAIQVVENLAVEHGMKAGRSTMRAYLQRYSPVLHFWGAYRIRGGQFTAMPEIGYTQVDDFNAFIMEAMSLRAALTSWAASRGRSDQSVISNNAFEPWTGWSRPTQKAGWPQLGAIPVSKLQTEIPWPRPPGRKPQLRPT